MKTLFFLICFVFTLNVFAGDGTWVKKTPITTLANQQYTLFEPQRATGEDTRIYNKMRAFVRLNYTRKLQSDRTHNYDWSVSVSFNYLVNGVTTAGNVTVSNEANGRVYEDYLEIPIPANALGYAITVTSVTGAYGNLGAGVSTTAATPQTSTFIPDDIDLTLELRSERVHNLNTASVIDDISRVSFNSTDFKLYWTYQQGAEEYDLEWVFIDKYSPEYTQIIAADGAHIANELTGFSLPFELVEPTRVRVWGFNYELDKAYPEGLLYFRVRSVSTFADQTNGISDDIRYGKWGYYIPSVQLNLCKFEITNALEFEQNKTWLYGISYADDGKSVSTLMYFDGSNRVHQDLTYSTSDNITLVGESKYDNEGRQTVNVIPAPVAGRNLLYQSNFNLASTGNIFDEEEIEQPSVPPLSTLSGAAKYFSKDNSFTGDLFRDAIPNANGYVFSQTIFRNDGTGRIESIGGVGSEFQASGIHASKALYGSTNAVELKRLFGDNVSDNPQGYRKHAMKDANGQWSVSYFDKRGHTIATALAGDAPNSLRKLDYTSEIISTSILNNTQIGNSLISEYTHPNTIPGSIITLNYDLSSMIQQIGSQTIEVEGYELSFGQFCADCAYKLRIEVIDQYGVTVGTPIIENNISSNSPCTPTSYSNTNYSVTLPNIGEYRIIKTLTVDEESMTAAFQAQLDAQGTSTYQTFLDEYLESVDITACFTDCYDYCYYEMRKQYLQTHTMDQWNGLTRSEIDYLLIPCTGTECDLDVITAENPIEVDPQDACENQKQRMLHQFSPGGVFYDDPGSYLWTGIGSSYGGYTLAQYQDEANFTDAMALALLPLHRENCMLQSGRCVTWMNLQNASYDFTDLVMSTPWSSTGVFAAPYNSLYDGLNNAFSMYSTLQGLVNNYGAANGATGNLYNYAESQGNAIAVMQASYGITYSGTELEELKKRLFLGVYLKIKWDLVKSLCGCTLYNDQNAIFMVPSDYNTMDAIIDGAIASIANAVDCEQVAIINVNNWIMALPVSCRDALGVTSFTLLTYPSTQATAMQTAYTNNSPNPSIAQLYYNYTMATCDVSTNANTFGLFYDPGTGNPGKSWYDAIRTKLAVSGCDYATGTNLPFQTSTPSGSGIAYTNYNPVDLREAIKHLTGTILVCGIGTSCQVNQYDQFIYNSTTINHYRIYEMTGVTSGMPAGYSGSVRMVKKWVSDNGVPNSDGYYYYFDMTITNGNCTFTIPRNKLVGIVNAGNVWGGNYYFRTNTPVTTGTWIDAIVGTYLDISVNDAPLSMRWDAYVGTFNGVSTNYLTTAITSDCPGTGNVLIDLGSSVEDLQNASFNQVDDCIQSQLLQAEADAQVMYNQIIGDLWTQFYTKMKSCLNATETFRMTYELKEYQYTLFYYDLAGNLVQTVPPQGVKPFTSAIVNADITDPNNNHFPPHEMETRYQYNGLNTMISNYTPDRGRADLYLDKLYRVRFSQNFQQKDINETKASYTKYDEIGRVIEAGEFKIPSGDNLVFKVDDPDYPVTGILDYSHTFYESKYVPPVTTAGSAPYPSTNAADPVLSGLFGPNGQQNLRNSVGAVMHRQGDYTIAGVLIPGTEVITVLSCSYNSNKQVTKIVSTNNHLATIGAQHKLTEYKYDLISGSVEEVVYQRGAWDEYRYRYNYNANNRLVRSYTSHNGDYWEQDAKYFYYLHGSLARRELGHDQVQGTDYAYNMQGWLKGVNSSTLDRTRDIGKDGNTGTDNQYFGVDAYGFSLGYYNGDYQAIKDAAESTQNYLNDYFAGTSDVTSLNQNPDAGNASMASLFNGNITHMVTALLDDKEARLDVLANNYQHDQLNRLREVKAYYATNLQTNNSFSGGALYLASGGESAFQESYTFDKNGNILTLKRNGGGRAANGNTTALAMDNMTYSYYTQAGGNTATPTNMNRLNSVSDAVTTDGYSGDISSGQLDLNYRYNKIGQLTVDGQENIQTIEWTVTGKVKKITYSTTGKAAGKRDVKFIYDPLDRRVAKLVYTNTDNTRIDWTYYSYDAAGNVLATYERTRAYTTTDATYNNYSDYYSIKDHMVYGASRLGLEIEQRGIANQSFRQSKTLSKDVEIAPSWQAITGGFTLMAPDYTLRQVGDKRYELSNHLNNVLEVISDRKVSGVSELIYKNTFDISSQALSDGFSVSGTGNLAFSSQRLVGMNTTNSSGVVRTITTVAGRFYQFKFNVDLNASGNVSAFVKDMAGTPITLVSTTISSTGDYMLSFMATSSNTQIGWSNISGATRSFYLDNIYIWDRSANNAQYAPDVISYSDYSPYGTLLDGRHGNDNTYRYGFQGQERDDEIKGAGNSYNYEYRMQDPRIGRFFACDPLESKYPWYTPYQFSGNKLIWCIELEGLEETKSGSNSSTEFGAGELTGSRFILNVSHLKNEYAFSQATYWSVTTTEITQFEKGQAAANLMATVPKNTLTETYAVNIDASKKYTDNFTYTKYDIYTEYIDVNYEFNNGTGELENITVNKLRVFVGTAVVAQISGSTTYSGIIEGKSTIIPRGFRGEYQVAETSKEVNHTRFQTTDLWKGRPISNAEDTRSYMHILKSTRMKGQYKTNSIHEYFSDEDVSDLFDNTVVAQDPAGSDISNAVGIILYVVNLFPPVKGLTTALTIIDGFNNIVGATAEPQIVGKDKFLKALKKMTNKSIIGATHFEFN
nr:hypothetical protein [uncultured Fluviicola sp.]